MVDALARDSRATTAAVIVAAGLAYALVAFVVSWLRSTPQERQRWKYRGRHGGGDSLLVDRPADPAMRERAGRLGAGYAVVTGLTILVAVLLIDYVNQFLGVVVVVVGLAGASVLRFQQLYALGWKPYRGRRRGSGSGARAPGRTPNTPS